MNKADYEAKLLQRINAGGNVPIGRIPTKSRESSLNKLLQQIMDDPNSNSHKKENENSEPEVLVLRRKTLWRFKSSDAPSPWLYGLIKIHKQDMPLREISSATDSPGHDLMKCVSLVLQPLVGNTSTFVKDGYHFISILRSGRFNQKNGIMVSLDIKALFPSLPMSAALSTLRQRLFCFHDLKKYSDLSAEEIMSLVVECTSKPWFKCELGTFLQKVGAPMGGPLSCLLADIYMEDYEQQIQFELNSMRVQIDWLRYRDDTWFLWEYSLDDLHIFINYLNSLNSSIQWTFEVEKDRTINFLDVLIKHEEDGSFTTTVYRKPTHSDRYLHFSSDHPLQQKLSVIHTLKYRAHAYCSNDVLLQAELQHLASTFLLNGFPENMVNEILFDSAMNEAPKLDYSDVEASERFGCLVIPYVPEIHRPLTTLCKNLGIHLLYSRKRNLGSLIAPKRPPSSTLETRNCVYKIHCKDCEMFYIGETKRKLVTRCKEHQYACNNAFQAGCIKHSERNDTGLPAHALSKNHTFDFDNPVVLHIEQNSSKRKFLEAIEILGAKQSVNLCKGRILDPNWAHILSMFSESPNSRDN
jgi:hypothetical protein